MKLFTKYKNIVFNIFFIIAISFFIYIKMPTVVKNYRLENTKLQNTNILRLSGNEISLPNSTKNKIIIFWATWCGPCHIEMKKLNNMILTGLVAPEDIIAISVDEKKETVLSFIEENNYQFLVAHDSTGLLAKKFNITGTPTIIFVNKNSNLDWVSTGISLNLESKVKEFYKN